ncbi:hemerythrin domain-containing protein [Rhabdothermincola salaria]|uniref:hemerythrin domain-containing protein n=1 Tax=Rhabdothermincola salaria TaxID=2903142 RepID=UPI001E4DE099|nr:hemerythrin domain-containing protein [Rhabdothermincola salaria]MCD9625428.1 hemerythrin domain-containing protein [Rhabdothermincola salaria]
MDDAPDTTTFRLIHRALRQSAGDLAVTIGQIPTGDRSRARALHWWYRGFAAYLHDHHVIEDDIFFPALAERVPTFAAYETGLAADHDHLDDVGGRLGEAIEGLALDGDWSVNQRVAIDASVQMARLVQSHLETEDDDVVPLFERHFTAAEFEALNARAVKYHDPRKLAFTVPWLVSTFSADETQAMFDSTPKMIELIWRMSRRRYARRTAAAFTVNSSAVTR